MRCRKCRKMLTRRLKPRKNYNVSREILRFPILTKLNFHCYSHSATPAFWNGKVISLDNKTWEVDKPAFLTRARLGPILIPWDWGSKVGSNPQIGSLFCPRINKKLYLMYLSSYIKGWCLVNIEHTASNVLTARKTVAVFKVCKFFLFFLWL